jgi:monothiol glutaredoxin
MPRPIFPESRLHPAIRATVAGLHADLIQEVVDAVDRHRVVVIGMAGNPFSLKAHRLLDEAGVEHIHLQFGGYFSQWRRRNALKMWTGWPTFPLVFIDGMLVGGADDLKRLIDSGELVRMLASPRAT